MLKKGLILIVFLLIMIGCIPKTNIFTSDDIISYQDIVLPLDSPEEAIQYSLSLMEVRHILLDKNNTAFEKYGEEWSSTAALVMPVGGSGKNFTEIYKDKMKQEGYIVNWMKGKKCDSYGFQLKFSLDGTLLVEDMKTSWSNCK